MDGAGFFALFIAIGSIGVSMLLGPIGQAIARRIAGKAPGTDPKTGLTTGEMTAERIAQLEERLVELEAAHAEAQERIDFAERLLGRVGAEPVKEPSS
jgi:hypothetical protein